MTKHITPRYTRVVLDELDSVIIDPSRWMSTTGEFEIHALQELVGKTVGVNKETGATTKRNPRMTRQELKAMKQVSSKVQEPEIRLVQKFSYCLVKSWLTIKGWFLYREAPRKVCQQIGHNCENCGMNLSFKDEVEIER